MAGFDRHRSRKQEEPAPFMSMMRVEDYWISEAPHVTDTIALIHELLLLSLQRSRLCQLLAPLGL
jgi:hypothetical protein